MNNKKDTLLGALIGLARATEGNEDLIKDETNQLVLECICMTSDYIDAEEESVDNILVRLDDEKRKLVPDCYTCQASCGRNDNFDVSMLSEEQEEIRALKMVMLSGIRDLAKTVLNETKDMEEINKHKMNLLYKALYIIGLKDCDREFVIEVTTELGSAL